MKLIARLLETFEPYVEKVETQPVRDIARVAVPLGTMIFMFAVVSLPFGLAGAIINGLVKVATAGQ